MADRQEVIKQRIYHIRVKGELDARWADWFESFVMASRENGETLLSGAGADQAALHGLLARIRDLNLPLISVNRVEPGAGSDVLGAGDAERNALP